MNQPNKRERVIVFVKAALLTRPGNAALPVGEQPDIIEKDLLAVARRIISIDV
jgi:2-haloacid dehalogenase